MSYKGIRNRYGVAPNYEGLLDTLDDVVFLVDDNQQIIYFNNHFSQQFQYDVTSSSEDAELFIQDIVEHSFYHDELNPSIQKILNQPDGFDQDNITLHTHLDDKRVEIKLYPYCLEIEQKKGVLIKLSELSIPDSKQPGTDYKKDYKVLINSLDMLPIYIITLNKKGEYMFINQLMANTFNVDRHEMKGSHYSKILPEPLLTIHEEYLAKALKGEEVEFTDHNVELDNVPEYAYGIYKPVVNQDGGVSGCCVFVVDVTKLKKTEEALSKSEKRLKKLNGMKNNLFSIIGHDLKNPLGNIVALSNLLLTDEDLTSSEIEEYASMIKKSGQQTTNLLDNLLVWARSQTGSAVPDKQIVNVKTVCHDILKLYDSLAHKKEIIIENAIHINYLVEADEEMLKTVLRNLISNAIKFTLSKGRIQISCEKEGNYLVISVTDNGIGITEQQQNTLFEPSPSDMKKSKGTGGETGTGLGLMISKKFIELNGGTIWVESKPKIGSTFYFTVPLSEVVK